MLKAKKIMALILTLVLVTIFASFTKTSALTSKVNTSKFVTVSYVMLGNKPTNGQFEKVMTKVNTLLKKKVNANLKLSWVEWSDWYTKYNLILASGAPLDLITSGSDWLDTWPNAQKGAFKNLDTLLPKYAPVTWASVPKENWDQSKYNGKIVVIPEDAYTQWINHGFIYRGDWAKEFGITAPITNWDTMGKYFQGIKDKKPGVIPWDMNGGGYNIAPFWFNSKTMGINIDAVPCAVGTSLFYGKSANDPYTVFSPYMDTTFMDLAKKMKTWGDAGYWREDVLNFKGDGWVEMKAGKNGTRQHHTQTFIGVWNEMQLAQPGANLEFFPFSAESKNLLSMSITHGCTALGARSKNPERALMVYDLIRNDKEIYQLFNYGIKGVQYVINKDGMRDLPAKYNFDKDNFYSDFWGGRNDKLEIPSATTYKNYKNLYAQYDKIKAVYPYGRFVFNKTPIDAELAALSDVCNQYLPAISFGKAGNPEQAVKDFRDGLKAAGYDKVLAEVQKQMTAYKKLVTGK